MCSKQQPFFHGRIAFGMPVDAGKSPADRYGERSPRRPAPSSVQTAPSTALLAALPFRPVKASTYAPGGDRGGARDFAFVPQARVGRGFYKGRWWS